MGTEQGEGDGAVPAEPAAKTMQVVVHSIAGEELLAMQCQADWIVSDIAGKVEPKLTGLWQVKLQLVDKVLQGNECLGDLASSGELELTAVFLRDTVAGVYAAWACSILVLHPDHRATYLWYDDYWEDPLVRSCPQKTAAEWASEEATGSWSLDGVNLSANAVEDYLSDDLHLTAKVTRSPEALKQGISEIMLVTRLYHKFGGDAERSTEPEEKIFYRVCHFDDETAVQLDEHGPGKHGDPAAT
mmetsp:Transcript_9240/g.21980  ORF Transcript_9240/g.21980 Transcript_9240/m.21980 type:complete len:244 (+) Transcript_9240:106-837(+)